MSNALHDSASGTTFINNNSTSSHIYGNGNITNNNRNVNLVFSSEAQAKPSVIIENALGKQHVPGASFEAQADSGCMPGTRVQFLSDVLAILKARSGPRIAWVAGMAGTGKTSIALTLCKQLRAESSVCLGGSFFCSRSAGSVERSDVRRIVPTLATTLARQLPDYASILAKQLEGTPEIGHHPVSTQVQQLLLQPFEAMPQQSQIVFVIDALDECSDQDKLAELLDALAASNNDKSVKFLLTSRPEMHIRKTPINDPRLSSILQLHQIDASQVMNDVRLYIQSTLDRLSESDPWYTTADIDALVRLSAGLFIFAATVVKYISDRGTVEGRQERLRKATSVATFSHAAIAPVDKIYEFILTEASRSDKVDDDERLATRHVIACILTVRASISVDALSELIGVRANDLRGRLDRLHSVVYLPLDNAAAGVQTLHASFGDYLFERASKELRISYSLGDEILARGCLQVMSRRLCFNISRSCSSYEPNSPTRSETITLALEYACLQWIYHIANLPQQSMLDEKIAKVFRPGFLFWLEIISVLGHVRRAAAMLIFAAATVQQPELSRFLRDANVFVTSSHEAIERSVPHIYLSALPFAAKDSLVHQDFTHLCGGVVSVQAVNVSRHGGRLVMTFSGHEGPVETVAHSPDGHLIVSGSRDGTIRIWDVRTGEQAMLPLQTDVDCIRSVAFAIDGKRVASGTESGIVHVWDVIAGGYAMRPLKGHSAAVLSVAFSPTDDFTSARLLASASADQTVKIWDAVSGESLSLIMGHSGCVRAVEFSPDGTILASGSDDRTIRLCHVDTGELAVQPLCADHLGVSSVCFSPDGMILASSSYDGSIRLWTWRARENTAVLRGHSDSVNSICFSPDGHSLLSASSDMTVRLWDLRHGHAEVISVVLGSHLGLISDVSCSPNGLYIASASHDSTIRMWHAGDHHATIKPLHAHTAGVGSVAVSPNGKFIVSASGDRSVRVWDIQTGSAKLEPLLGHEGEVYSVAISSDGRMIASGSADHTVRLWDARTGTTIGATRGCEDEAKHVSFSLDMKWLASGSANGTVSIWEVPTWLPASFSPLRCVSDLAVQSLATSRRPISGVSFSSDGQRLAVSIFESGVQLWHTSTGKPTNSPFRANIGVIFGPWPEPGLKTAISLLPDWYLRGVVEQLPEWCLHVIVDQMPESDLQVAILKLPNLDLHSTVERLLQVDLRAIVCQLPEVALQNAVNALLPETLLGAISELPQSKLRAIVSRQPERSLRDAFTRLAPSELFALAYQFLEADLRASVGRLSQISLRLAIDQMLESDLRALVYQISESELREAIYQLPELDVALPAEYPSAAAEQLTDEDVHTIVGQLPLLELRAVFAQLPESDLRTMIGQVLELDLRASIEQAPRSELRAAVSQLPESELRAAVQRLSEPSLINAVAQQCASSLRTVISHLSQAYLSAVAAQVPASDLHLTVVRLSHSTLRTIVTQLSNPDLCALICQKFEPEPHALVLQVPVSELRAAIGRMPDVDLHTSIGWGRTLQLSQVLLSWGEGTMSIAFSPDAAKIASGVLNGTVYVWDVNRRSQILALPGHSGPVYAVAYSPDGRTICSGSEDTTVRLWDTESGTVLAVQRGHTKRVRSVAFTPDGKSIVSGADDGTIRIWDVEVAISLASADADDLFKALAHARYDKDWLVGPEGELLLWVPQEYQANLIIGDHCRTLIASHRVFLTVDESGLYGGEDWTKCWRGPTTLPRF